jgi:hypothetical protein
MIEQLDSTYNVGFKVAAVGGDVHGDLHEFKITDDNTALMTIYNVTNADLSPIGRPKHGWIKDSVFQEIDVATGGLLFEWRASEHFPPHETHMTQPFAGYTPSIPMDSFHINSIDKDSHGNYLVSSRHLHAIICISPAGETLWILGGNHNQFTDLSHGAATSFKWQHDARWHSEHDGILTLFDNQEGGILHAEAPYSKGMMLKVDVQNRTAELLQSYISLQKTRAPSQGSLQVLTKTGNVFVGWGHSAAYTEFAADGTLLCETHFGASWLYFWGRVVSYRAFKTRDWVGRPEYPPSVRIQSGRLYVSWNGATEVDAWELQGLEEEDEEDDVTLFESLDVIEKVGFEASFAVPDASRYRVAALDRDGAVLGVSDAISPEDSRFVLRFSLALVGCLVTLVGIRLWYKRRMGRRASLANGRQYRKL